MTYKITYNPEVKKDIQEAVIWYNKKQDGLGKEFFKNIQNHISILKNSAHGFPCRYDKVHCLPVYKFPYMIHYRINSKLKTVRIEAILHTSRDPQNWLKRINK